MITENKIFSYAIIASLLIHIVIFWNLAYTNIRFQKIKSPRVIKVTYASPKLQKKAVAAPPMLEKGMKIDVTQQTKVAKEEQKNISSFLKDISKKTDDFIRVSQKPKILEEKKIKRRVAVPAVETAQIKNPSYLSYYQVVRNRIKERAYANYESYGKPDSGEVYLTFILDANGMLKKINIIDDRTKANQNLRQISIRSVEESSAFPAFPPELSYPELSFNAIISYEVE